MSSCHSAEIILTRNTHPRKHSIHIHQSYPLRASIPSASPLSVAPALERKLCIVPRHISAPQYQCQYHEHEHEQHPYGDADEHPLVRVAEQRR